MSAPEAFVDALARFGRLFDPERIRAALSGWLKLRAREEYAIQDSFFAWGVRPMQIQRAIALAAPTSNRLQLTLRRIAGICLHLWHGVPSVGTNLVLGIAIFYMVRIPAEELGRRFDRVVTPLLLASPLALRVYEVPRMLIQAASFVLIGWIIGGLSSRRRAMALGGAIANVAFLVWWYSTVAEIPASQSAYYLARELPIIAIGIGGIVVGYRLWRTKARSDRTR